MCLISEQKRTKLARKRITCYKILNCMYDNIVYTPVMQRIVNIEELSGEVPFKALGEIQKETGCCDDGHYVYTRGLIHTLLLMPDRSYFNDRYIICKCYVPKLTRYVVSYNKRELASRKIIFDEIIWDGRNQLDNMVNKELNKCDK